MIWVYFFMVTTFIAILIGCGIYDHLREQRYWTKYWIKRYKELRDAFEFEINKFKDEDSFWKG